MSKEIPILFSPPMAVTTVKGIKTQTMRMDGLDEINKEPDAWRVLERNFLGQYTFVKHGVAPDRYLFINPRYRVGDILWGREAWRADKRYDHLAPRDIPVGEKIRYEADGQFNDSPVSAFIPGKLRQSIFMPRWASRIKRQIIGVELGRVQDITEDQAVAEGAPKHDSTLSGIAGVLDDGDQGNHIITFKNIWNSINAKRGLGWGVNPWAFAIKYEEV